MSLSRQGGLLQGFMTGLQAARQTNMELSEIEFRRDEASKDRDFERSKFQAGKTQADEKRKSLAQDQLDKISVNRLKNDANLNSAKDILDAAIVRPGRLDRLIHIPKPNKESRKAILEIHMKRMKREKSLNSDVLVSLMEGFSGAEIKASCTEAGYFAIRENRSIIKKIDFIKGIEKVKRTEGLEGTDYMGMFG